jgi:hypothetical protein
MTPCRRAPRSNRRNCRLLAGHPVLADNAEVWISVFSDGKSEVRAAVNNVGMRRCRSRSA